MTQNLIRRLSAAPTLGVRETAELIGVPRSTFFEAVRIGTAPVRTIRIGGHTRVLTASVAELLGIDLNAPDCVRSGETPGQHRRSEAMPDAATTRGVKCCEACGSPIAPAQRVG